MNFIVTWSETTHGTPKMNLFNSNTLLRHYVFLSVVNIPIDLFFQTDCHLLMWNYSVWFFSETVCHQDRGTGSTWKVSAEKLSQHDKLMFFEMVLSHDHMSAAEKKILTYSFFYVYMNQIFLMVMWINLSWSSECDVPVTVSLSNVKNHEYYFSKTFRHFLTSIGTLSCCDIYVHFRFLYEPIFTWMVSLNENKNVNSEYCGAGATKITMYDTRKDAK